MTENEYTNRLQILLDRYIQLLLTVTSGYNDNLGIQYLAEMNKILTDIVNTHNEYSLMKQGMINQINPTC